MSDTKAPALAASAETDREERGPQRQTTWSLTSDKHTDEQFKQICKDDRAALSIVAALVMTVTMSNLLTDPSTLKQQRHGIGQSFFTGLFVLSNTVSCCSAILGLWVGSYQYLVMNKTPARLASKVAHALKLGWGLNIEIPIFWVMLSLYGLLVALLATVALLHTTSLLLAATCLTVFTAVLLSALTMKMRGVWVKYVVGDGQVSLHGTPTSSLTKGNDLAKRADSALL